MGFSLANALILAYHALACYKGLSGREEKTVTESVTQRETPYPVSEEEIFCPICHLLTGRLIRGKLYCGNCGFIES